MRRRHPYVLWGWMVLYGILLVDAAVVLLWTATGSLSVWWMPVPVAAIVLSLVMMRRLWWLLH